jgi:Zn-finger nucleic acid-binding protein
MADASTLHCPNCGAPAAPTDQSCKYCHATLATVSCPKCFALMFEGAAYCPSCGARRARTDAGERKARCSACFGLMHEVQIGDTGLMECEKCHAMWVDTATFEHICSDRGTQTAVLGQYGTPPSPSAAAADVKYRRCVACGKMMNRLNFGRVSGTVVDLCKGHGVFLDSGELHQIVTFIQSGGLDRARQRQIEDLKEEEDRLRALRQQEQIFGDRSLHSDAENTTNTTWADVDILTLLQHLGQKQR